MILAAVLSDHIQSSDEVSELHLNGFFVHMIKSLYILSVYNVHGHLVWLEYGIVYSHACS